MSRRRNTLHMKYSPKNTEKYIGTYPIMCRSSWEVAFCRMADRNPNVIHWASESVKIPYKHPFTNKYSVYVPDFFIVYEDKLGKRHAELIEVKPAKETNIEEAKSLRDKQALVINMAKWQAAQAWAKQKGITFRVLTENDIFATTKKRK